MDLGGQGVWGRAGGMGPPAPAAAPPAMEGDPGRTARARGRAGREALPRLWAWLTDTGYRPERRYMRGGRPPAAGPRP
jgi:hypothetical protein